MKILSDRRRGWRVKVGERKRGRMESEGKRGGEGGWRVKGREEERRKEKRKGDGTEENGGGKGRGGKRDEEGRKS